MDMSCSQPAGECRAVEDQDCSEGQLEAKVLIRPGPDQLPFGMDRPVLIESYFEFDPDVLFERQGFIKALQQIRCGFDIAGRIGWKQHHARRRNQGGQSKLSPPNIPLN